MSDDGDDSNTPHVHVADEREEVRTERAMVGVSDHGKVLRSGKGDAGIRSEFDQGDGGMEQGGEDDGESTGFEYSGDASEDLQLRAPKRRQVRAGDEVGVLGRDDQESHDPVRDRSPSRMREVEIVGNDEREGYFDNAPAGFSYVELPEPKRRRRMEPPTESIKAIHKRTREYVHLADVEAFLGKPGLTSPSFLLRRELSGRVPGICHPGEHSKKLSKVDSDVPSSSEQAAGVRGDEGNPNAVSGPSDADGSGEGVRRVEVERKKSYALKTAEQWGSTSSQSVNSLAGPNCTQKLFDRLCCQNLRGITMGVEVNTHSYNRLCEYYRDVHLEYQAHQEELESKQFPFTFASPVLSNFAHYHMTREDEMELHARHNIGNRTIFAGNVVLLFLIEKTNSNSVFPVERGDLFMMQLNGIDDSFIVVCKQGHYTNGSLFNLVNTSFDVTYVCNSHYTPHFLSCGNSPSCSHTFSFSIPHEGHSERNNVVMLGFGMVLSHEQDWPEGGQVEKDGYCRFTQYIEMPGVYMATIAPRGEVMHRMFTGRCCHSDYHVFALDRPSENMVQKTGEIVNVCDFATDAPVRYCLDCAEIEHISVIPKTTVRRTCVYNLEVPLVLQKIEIYNSFNKEEHRKSDVQSQEYCLSTCDRINEAFAYGEIKWISTHHHPDTKAFEYMPHTDEGENEHHAVFQVRFVDNDPEGGSVPEAFMQASAALAKYHAAMMPAPGHLLDIPEEVGKDLDENAWIEGPCGEKYLQILEREYLSKTTNALLATRMPLMRLFLLTEKVRKNIVGSTIKALCTSLGKACLRPDRSVLTTLFINHAEYTANKGLLKKSVQYQVGPLSFQRGLNGKLDILIANLISLCPTCHFPTTMWLVIPCLSALKQELWSVCTKCQAVQDHGLEGILYSYQYLPVLLEVFTLGTSLSLRLSSLHVPGDQQLKRESHSFKVMSESKTKTSQISARDVQLSYKQPVRFFKETFTQKSACTVVFPTKSAVKNFETEEPELEESKEKVRVREELRLQTNSKISPGYFCQCFASLSNWMRTKMMHHFQVVDNKLTLDLDCREEGPLPAIPLKWVSSHVEVLSLPLLVAIAKLQPCCRRIADRLLFSLRHEHLRQFLVFHLMFWNNVDWGTPSESSDLLDDCKAFPQEEVHLVVHSLRDVLAKMDEVMWGHYHYFPPVLAPLMYNYFIRIFSSPDFGLIYQPLTQEFVTHFPECMVAFQRIIREQLDSFRSQKKQTLSAIFSGPNFVEWTSGIASDLVQVMNHLDQIDPTLNLHGVKVLRLERVGIKHWVTKTFPKQVLESRSMAAEKKLFEHHLPLDLEPAKHMLDLLNHEIDQSERDLEALEIQKAPAEKFVKPRLGHAALLLQKVSSLKQIAALEKELFDFRSGLSLDYPVRPREEDDESMLGERILSDKEVNYTVLPDLEAERMRQNCLISGKVAQVPPLINPTPIPVPSITIHHPPAESDPEDPEPNPEPMSVEEKNPYVDLDEELTAQLKLQEKNLKFLEEMYESQKESPTPEKLATLKLKIEEKRLELDAMNTKIKEVTEQLFETLQVPLSTEELGEQYQSFLKAKTHHTKRKYLMNHPKLMTHIREMDVALFEKLYGTAGMKSVGYSRGMWFRMVTGEKFQMPTIWDPKSGMPAHTVCLQNKPSYFCPLYVLNSDKDQRDLLRKHPLLKSYMRSHHPDELHRLLPDFPVGSPEKDSLVNPSSPVRSEPSLSSKEKSAYQALRKRADDMEASMCSLMQKVKDVNDSWEDHTKRIMEAQKKQELVQTELKNRESLLKKAHTSKMTLKHWRSLNALDAIVEDPSPSPSVVPPTWFIDPTPSTSSEPIENSQMQEMQHTEKNTWTTVSKKDQKKKLKLSKSPIQNPHAKPSSSSGKARALYVSGRENPVHTVHACAIRARPEPKYPLKHNYHE